MKCNGRIVKAVARTVTRSFRFHRPALHNQPVRPGSVPALLRRRHLLHGGRVIRREGRVFLSENARSDKKIAISRPRDARSDEKIASCRRRTRTPTRRWRLLVGGRTLRREGCVFSSENAYSDKKITASRRWPFLRDPWSAGSSSKVCALTSRERSVLSARVTTSAL